MIRGQVPATPKRIGVSQTAVALACLLGSVFALAAPADAHAELRETQPVAGAQLEGPPGQVILTFSESVGFSPGAIQLYGSSGDRLDRNRPFHPPGRQESVALELPELSDGAYVVTWRVVSGDGHAIRGAFTFRIGTVPGDGDAQALARRLLAGEGEDPLVGGLHAVNRGLMFASLLFLVGGMVFMAFLWPRGASLRPARRPLAWAVATTALTTVFGVGLQGAFTGAHALAAAFDPAILAATLTTRYGSAAVVRLVLLAATALILVAFGRVSEDRPGRRLLMGAVGFTGVALLATVSASGHATTGRWIGAALAADAIHLSAASIWLGGLAFLVLSVFRLSSGPELVRLTHRFSTLALGAVVVILATGLFQSWRQLGSVAALTATTYGQILAVKVGLFAVMVTIAAVSRSRLRRSTDQPSPNGTGSRDGAPGPRPLRRSVLTEAVIGLAIVAATALLTAAIPGRTALALPFETEMRAGDSLLVEAVVDPAKAGPVDLHLYTLTPEGLPAEVEEVSARLQLDAYDIAPIAVPLQRAGPNHFVAYDFDIPLAGEWTIDVIVRISQDERRGAQAAVPIR